MAASPAQLSLGPSSLELLVDQVHHMDIDGPPAANGLEDDRAGFLG